MARIYNPSGQPVGRVARRRAALMSQSELRAEIENAERAGESYNGSPLKRSLMQRVIQFILGEPPHLP